MQQTRPLFGLVSQHIDESMTGAILHMQHPVMTVGRLQRGGQAAIAIAIKLHAQLQEPIHTLRCLIHQQSNGIPIAEPCSGMNGVRGVATAAVVWSCDGGNASLCPKTGRSTARVAVDEQNGVRQAARDRSSDLRHRHQPPRHPKDRRGSVPFLARRCHG